MERDKGGGALSTMALAELTLENMFQSSLPLPQSRIFTAQDARKSIRLGRCLAQHTLESTCTFHPY
jgi:hypothetical protein